MTGPLQHAGGSAEGSPAIGIVGLGMIGGSIAHALAALSPRPRVIAVEPQRQVRDAAAALCEAHGELTALSPCDLVLLCAPVAVIEQQLAPVSAVLRDGAILSDVAGIKAPILAAAARDVRPGVTFVGAHPMFGGERGGFFAASAERVRGGVVALCEDGAGAAALERVESLYASIGARVVRCRAEPHDVAMARVSHLPYVAAHALHDVAIHDELARALAGPGFAGATRLAAFAYEIQGEVARRNPYLPAAIDALIDELRAIRDALASPEEAARRLREKRHV